MKREIHSKISHYIGLMCILLFIFVQKAHTQSESTDQNTAFDIDSVKKEIKQRIRDYENALDQGDFLTLGKMYTIDAEILHNGRSSTVGRDNITKVFEKMVADSITNSGFTTTGLWGNNDMLVEQGTGFFAHSTGKWISKGIYLLVWKKVDGEWQIFRDTWFKQGD